MQRSQIGISDELIRDMWMDGGGGDRSKEDRFDVVFGDRVSRCLRHEDGMVARGKVLFTGLTVLFGLIWVCTALSQRRFEV